jgi:general stress protein 26
MPDQQADTQRVWDMMTTPCTCLLVSHRGGRMHGRPMASIVRQNEHKVYFLSDKKSAKESEITDVYLGYSDLSSEHVSLNGRASLSKDKALIKRLWNPGAQALWPQGPDAAEIDVYRGRTRFGAVLGRTARRDLVGQMACAAATKSRPNLGDNQKVAL